MLDKAQISRGEELRDLSWKGGNFLKVSKKWGE